MTHKRRKNTTHDPYRLLRSREPLVLNFNLHPNDKGSVQALLRLL